MFRAASVFTLVLSAAISSSAHAQDDRAAGLFTEARQLPLVSQSISVRATSAEAELSIVQVFANAGREIGQADYHLYVPEGATVSGFGFWQGDRFLESELKAKQAAEAAHRAAADSGRATAIMKSEGSIVTFSVYPVRAGELKRVEFSMRLPVVREMGRSHVRLPVDRFLGQTGSTSTMWIRIAGDDPLAGFGVDGAEPTIIAKTASGGEMALSADRAVDVWWKEIGAPLVTQAEAVPLEGSRGVEIRIVLNDAGTWRAPRSSLRLVVDGSFSMRRRAHAVEALIARIAARSPAPVEVELFGERAFDVGADPKGTKTSAAILEGRAGHALDPSALAGHLGKLGCRGAVACALVTDPQVDGLEEMSKLEVPLIFVGDPHEMAFFGPRLPASSARFVLGADQTAKLQSIADELVLPVLRVISLTQNARPIDLIGRQARAVPEGGMLHLYAQADTSLPITLEAEIDGHPITRALTLDEVDPAGENGRRVRRGVYTKMLASMMARYAEDPKDETLKQAIIDLSLREQIPTALTALQVSDPELNMVAIKPGDPLLSVRDEPGLVRVVARYPFGESRALVLDPGSGGGTWIDRFLVPRHWEDRSYRIEVFKTFENGEVRAEHVWYVLDDQAPAAAFRLDHGALEIDTGDDTWAISSVSGHLASGKVLELSPVGTKWIVPASEITSPSMVTIFVRDRAGNRRKYVVSISGDQIKVDPVVRPAKLERRAGVVEADAVEASIAGNDVVLAGREVRLSTGQRLAAHILGAAIHAAGAGPGLLTRSASFDLGSVPDLRSLHLTRLLARDASHLVFGTEGGDLISLTCSHGQAAPCMAEALDRGRFLEHPITGLAPLSGDGSRILVGVLGEGLWIIDGNKVRPVPEAMRLSSRFVTDLGAYKGDVYVTTAYGGVWKIHHGRALKMRFPEKGAHRVRASGGRLEIEGGTGSYVLRGGELVKMARSGKAGISSGQPGIMAAVEWNGAIVAGGFDRGLLRWNAAARTSEPIATVPPLSPKERQVNALAVAGGHLYVGSEAGLIEISVAGDGTWSPARILEGSVHDLSVGRDSRMAIASSRGLFVREADGTILPIGRQGEHHKLFAVAWLDQEIYAGGMDGLYRTSKGVDHLEPIAGAKGWVTALFEDGARLLVGTYGDGVYAVEGGAFRAIEGLESQWVPVHAIRRIGREIWIGGLGMPALRIDAGEKVHAMPLPVRDVNDFIQAGEATYLLTTDGIVPVERPASGARVRS